MRFAVFLQCIGFAFVGPLLALSVPEVRAAEVDLRQTWVRTGEVITPEKFDQLLELMHEDPETDRLLQDVTRKLGASSPQEILKIVSLCDTKVGGNSRTREWTVTGPLKFPVKGAQPRLPEEERIRASYLKRRIITPTEVRLDFAYPHAICLAADKSLLETYSAIVHELTHFLGDQAFDEVDVLRFEDEDHYVREELESRGGELEAYVADGSATLRLKKKRGGWMLPGFATEKFFDADGKLVDREGLKKAILDSGYGADFRAQFAREVKRQFQDALKMRDDHRRYAANARRDAKDFEQRLKAAKARMESLKKKRTKPAEVQALQKSILDLQARHRFFSQYAVRAEKRSQELDRRQQAIAMKFPTHLSR